MPDAFLDSTALIELVFRHREARSRVELSVPTGGCLLTSWYVLFEIARGYLRSVILLHNRAHAVQSLHQLHEYMHAGQQLFRPYRRETLLGAYEDFLVHLENLGLSLTEEQRLSHFRGWFALHLRRGWRELSRVAEIVNRVGCREDIPPPTPKAHGWRRWRPAILKLSEEFSRCVACLHALPARTSLGKTAGHVAMPLSATNVRAMQWWLPRIASTSSRFAH